MTADTDVANLLRICSAFEMCLKKGQKVAVHCHAGTGRTGVAIVSWLIYGEGMTADEGIKLF
jgi:protein tyrosine phosphatase domain-containing protein 1